jgi:hypothetical protein
MKEELSVGSLSSQKFHLRSLLTLNFDELNLSGDGLTLTAYLTLSRLTSTRGRFTFRVMTCT